jgi:hypothetical protein
MRWTKRSWRAMAAAAQTAAAAESAAPSLDLYSVDGRYRRWEARDTRRRVAARRRLRRHLTRRVMTYPACLDPKARKHTAHPAVGVDDERWRRSFGTRRAGRSPGRGGRPIHGKRPFVMLRRHVASGGKSAAAAAARRPECPVFGHHGRASWVKITAHKIETKYRC